MEFLTSKSHEDYVQTIKSNMAPYYVESGVDWNDASKLAHYKECDLYTINSGREIGFLMFKEQGSVIYLAELHISDLYQTRGYGSKAIAWARNHAAKLGYDEIRVRVFQSNPAYNLYLRHGFSFEKELPYTHQLLAKTLDKHSLPD